LLIKFIKAASAHTFVTLCTIGRAASNPFHNRSTPLLLKPIAHVVVSIAPANSSLPPHRLTLTPHNKGFKTLAQISEHFNHGSVRRKL
jgi:predicted metallo-beta-lactamase superfamily hydrolase